MKNLGIIRYPLNYELVKMSLRHWPEFVKMSTGED